MNSTDLIIIGSLCFSALLVDCILLGQPYQGNKIMPRPAVGGSGAHKVVARYPAGAQVMVYYDPNKPPMPSLSVACRAISSGCGLGANSRKDVFCHYKVVTLALPFCR